MSNRNCEGCGAPAERVITLTDLDGTVLDRAQLCIACALETTVTGQADRLDGPEAPQGWTSRRDLHRKVRP